jgi:hypothetical protein
MTKGEETRLRNLFAKERVENLSKAEKVALRRLAKKKKQEGSPRELPREALGGTPVPLPNT